jgi:hypothetical protein
MIQPDGGAGLAAIIRDNSGRSRVRAAARLLGLDEVGAAAFLREYTPPPKAAKPRVRAFNAPVLTTDADAPRELVQAVAEANHKARNAAKAQRRRPAKPGPAEQPRRPRRARHVRRHAK